MIDLYTTSSPNGFKATVALTELELPYRLHHVDLSKGENGRPDFLALNPHGRIPVIVDRETGITVFESAAILLYLAKKAGRLLPEDGKAYWEAIKWLQFHSLSMGPILAQRVYFEMFADKKQPAAIERYRDLTADIATFGWTHIARVCDFMFDEYENLMRWHEGVAARPAVQCGIILPAPATGP